MAPDEVTIWFLRLLDAKNTGRAKHANHRNGDTPFELAVQLPVIRLAKMYNVIAFASTCNDTSIWATLYSTSFFKEISLQSAIGIR